MASAGFHERGPALQVIENGIIPKLGLEDPKDLLVTHLISPGLNKHGDEVFRRVMDHYDPGVLFPAGFPRADPGVLDKMREEGVALGRLKKLSSVRDSGS